MSDNLSGPPTDQRKSAYADDTQQLTRLGQFCYVLICLHVLFFDYIAVAHHTIYDFLTMKEGTVEILTSVAFLLGSVMLFAAALAERRLLPRCAYVLGGMALLFFGGEEISWGQSIIGFETPDFLADLNTRGEANIHNTSAFGYVLDSNQRPALLTLCIAACAVSVVRKNRVLGIPAPSILLTLAFLVTMSHFYPPSYISAFNFENFTLQHRGLFLLLLMVALLSMNARLFIAVGASWSLSSLTDYVFHHHWSHHGARLPFAEISEYLFSLCCLLYALHLLLDQKAARQKIASAGAAIKSAATLPSIRIKSPPPPDIWGKRKSLAAIKKRSITTWTSICALIIASSIGLALMTHFHYRADVAAFQEIQSLTRTLAPAARSNFDVYIDGRYLRYFKQPCVRRPDLAATFFLGVYPVNADDLPLERRPHGFENLDFAFGQHGQILDDACAITVMLPAYEIARISTGQYTWHENGVATNLWIAEFPVSEHKADAAAIEETRLLTQTIEPAARSNFDVYIDGRDLHYFKQPCGYADVIATFFLGVFPQNVDDLPVGQRQNGFANLDFDFEVDAGGSILDSACAAKVRLPGYEIARVSTGQYTWDADGAPTNLWIAEFPVNK